MSKVNENMRVSKYQLEHLEHFFFRILFFEWERTSALSRKTKESKMCYRINVGDNALLENSRYIFTINS